MHEQAAERGLPQRSRSTAPAHENPAGAWKTPWAPQLGPSIQDVSDRVGQRLLGLGLRERNKRLLGLSAELLTLPASVVEATTFGDDGDHIGDLRILWKRILKERLHPAPLVGRHVWQGGDQRQGHLVLAQVTPARLPRHSFSLGIVEKVVRDLKGHP